MPAHFPGMKQGRFHSDVPGVVLRPSSSSSPSSSTKASPPSSKASPPPPVHSEVCEVCSGPATLTCGVCTELYLCHNDSCFDAAHTRPRDRESHRSRLLSFGVSSKCSIHPDHEVSRVCAAADCRGTLVCTRCERHGHHKGHASIPIDDVFEAHRDAACTAGGAVAAAQRIVSERSHDTEARKKETHSVEHSVKKRLKDALLRYLSAGETVERGAVLVEEEAHRVVLTHTIHSYIEHQTDRAYLRNASSIVRCTDALRHLQDQPLRIACDSAALQARIAALGPPPRPWGGSVVYRKPDVCSCYDTTRLFLQGGNFVWAEGKGFAVSQEGKRAGCEMQGFWNLATTTTPLTEDTILRLRVQNLQNPHYLELGYFNEACSRGDNHFKSEGGTSITLNLPLQLAKLDFEFTLHGNTLSCKCTTNDHITTLKVTTPVYIACALLYGAVDIV